MLWHQSSFRQGRLHRTKTDPFRSWSHSVVQKKRATYEPRTLCTYYVRMPIVAASSSVGCAAAVPRRRCVAWCSVRFVSRRGDGAQTVAKDDTKKTAFVPRGKNEKTSVPCPPLTRLFSSRKEAATREGGSVSVVTEARAQQAKE